MQTYGECFGVYAFRTVAFMIRDIRPLANVIQREGMML
uniref:Uncharacterized protein n=1 Tax=Parascaris equorum TaxID=6256 RepID=A0A914RTQ7_PAREQ